MVASLRPYVALISTDPAQPAKRVTVLAQSLDDAMEQLEARHGKGTVFDLHSEEDAERPRSPG